MARTARDVRERFEEKYIPEPNSGCWLWTGVTRHDGYGLLHVGSKMDGSARNVRAHVLSYSIHICDVPDGFFVCHKCDNPTCVNPDHLFLGTQRDNMRDMAAKGRQVFQRNPEKAPRGERNGTHTKPESRLFGDRNWTRRERAKFLASCCGEKHWTRRMPETLARGAEHWSHRMPDRVMRGDRHGRAKISRAQAMNIGFLMAFGATAKNAAEWLGVGKHTCHQISSGLTWKGGW